jgi:hypothetical protein
VATLIVAIVSHSHTRSKSIFTRCGNKTKARETQQQQQMGLCTLGKWFIFRKKDECFLRSFSQDHHESPTVCDWNPSSTCART